MCVNEGKGNEKERERTIDIYAPSFLRISPRPGSISSEPVGRDGNENFTSEFFRIRIPLFGYCMGCLLLVVPSEESGTIATPPCVTLH